MFVWDFPHFPPQIMTLQQCRTLFSIFALFSRSSSLYKLPIGLKWGKLVNETGAGSSQNIIDWHICLLPTAAEEETQTERKSSTNRSSSTSQATTGSGGDVKKQSGRWEFGACFRIHSATCVNLHHHLNGKCLLLIYSVHCWETPDYQNKLALQIICIFEVKEWAGCDNIICQR